jgi:hypothetical protein
MRVEVAESTPAEAAEASPAAGEVAESAPPTAPIEVAEASPAVAESPPAPPDLDTASDEELALVLEIETIEDLGAIANLDLLERILLMEEGAG